MRRRINRKGVVGTGKEVGAVGIDLLPFLGVRCDGGLNRILIDTIMIKGTFEETWPTRGL